MAPEPSLLQDGVTPGPSGTFPLLEGVASPVLSPFTNTPMLEEVTPIPESSDTWGAFLGSTEWTEMEVCTLY